MEFSILDILSAFMVLFAVIDITGSIPIIIGIKNKGGQIKSLQATLVAYIIMLAFLFLGDSLLGIFGVDISSFAIAGAFILLLLSLEMVLGVEIFKSDAGNQGASIVPIAFPLIAGAGSITSLISLKAEYSTLNIAIALTMNMIIVYFVLKATRFFEKLIGPAGIMILKKFFGVILLAIAIRLFVSNTGINLTNIAGN